MKRVSSVTVRDNGKGFDPEQVTLRPGRGNGLKNLRQRLEKIGGRCEIQSVPGSGTGIKFFVSVPATARKSVEQSKSVIN